MKRVISYKEVQRSGRNRDLSSIGMVVDPLIGSGRRRVALGTVMLSIDSTTSGMVVLLMVGGSNDTGAGVSSKIRFTSLGHKLSKHVVSWGCGRGGSDRFLGIIEDGGGDKNVIASMDVADSSSSTSSSIGEIIRNVLICLKVKQGDGAVPPRGSSGRRLMLFLM